MSSAQKQLSTFFSAIGKQKVNDPLKGIAESTKKTGLAAKNAAGQVKELGNAGKAAGSQLSGLGNNADTGLKSIGSSAKNTGKSLGTLANNAKTLGSAFVNIGKGRPLQPVATSLKNLQTPTRSATTAFGSLKTAINSAAQGSNLQAIGGAITGLNGPLSAATTGIQQFDQELEDAGETGGTFADQISNGFQQILQGIPQGIGMAIGQQLLAPLQGLTQIVPSAVSQFRDLEEVISQTLAVIGGGSGEFAQLSDSILKVSSSTAATAQEVGEVALSLSRAGFSLQEVDEALGGVVQGAEATGTSYENMGNIVVNAIGAFGKTAADATDIVDSLTVAANNSNQSVDDLGEALKYVGPVANSTGQSLEDTSLALQLLANSGIKGSQAGTSFRTILTNLQIAASGAGEEFTSLSRGSTRLENALKAIGANMTDANGELLKGEELIAELRTSMDGLSSGEKALVSKALAGSEGLPALNTLINATGEQVAGLADKLENRAGAAAKGAETALSGLSGSFKLLESNISAFLVQVGAVIAVVLKPLVDLATAILSGFNSLPGPIKSVAVALGLLTAAVIAVNVAMTAFQQISKTAFGQKLAGQILDMASNFTKANLTATIAGWGTSIKEFAKGGIKTLTKGLNAGAGLLTKFSTSLATVGTASTVAGTGTAAATAGVAATGAAAGGASLGVGALAASFGAFIVAAAPFIAIGAGIAAIFIAIKRNMDAYKTVSEPLKGSTEMLVGAMDKLDKGTDEVSGGFNHWGDALADFLGPFDRFLTALLGPAYGAIKLFLNAMSWVDNINRNGAAISAATDDYNKFDQQMQIVNGRIEENRAKMKGLEPGSKEFGRLAAENETLVRAQSTAIADKIKAIDATIGKLKENEGANRATISVLEDQKAAYEQSQVVINANKHLLIEERKAVEEATGKTVGYIAAMQDAATAREQVISKNTAKAYQLELQNINDLREGLIDENVSRARTAQLAVDSANEKIAADNKLAAATTEAYKRGLIPTQEEYRKKMSDITGDIVESVRNRAEAEKQLTEATKAAIDARLGKMQEEIAAVEANASRINTALSQIFSVQGSGYGALQGLVNSIAGLELAKIDKVKGRVSLIKTVCRLAFNMC